MKDILNRLDGMCVKLRWRSEVTVDVFKEKVRSREGAVATYIRYDGR
jgi:hypothetical protein